MDSFLKKSVDKMDRLPSFIRSWAKNYALGMAVPFVKRAGIDFKKTTSNEWIAVVKNVPNNRNHLGQVHAAAMMLVAETVGVMIMSYNLPADGLPLVKKVEFAFIKRSSGAIKAIAQLTPEQIETIKTNPKGEVVIEVKMSDEAGNEPVIAKVVSAWIPKKRK